MVCFLQRSPSSRRIVGMNPFASLERFLWGRIHNGINTASVKVAAGVYGIPIKRDLNFNKVELFLEVTTFLM